MSTRNSSIPTKKYRLILSAVHMVYRLVNSTYNVRELALRLTRLLCQFVSGSSSTIYILDPVKKRIVLKASFDNKINILVTKKKELAQIPTEEKKVTQGYVIFGKHCLGLPLVADENVGAIFVRRKSHEPAFNEFDKEMLSVVVEQAVTAIKNLQLYEQQQKIILGSIEFIGKLLKGRSHTDSVSQKPVYFKIVKILGEKLGIRQEDIENLYYASILRDAGAMDVPYDILSKTSQLSSAEFKIIREQPTRSVELIKPIEFLQPVLPIILYHHEKFDGTGYPSGLKKEQIPLGARIIAVVDAFMAMVRERPYKKQLSNSDALVELKHNSGTQFDPRVVEAFVSLSNQKKFRNYLSSARE